MESKQQLINTLKKLLPRLFRRHFLRVCFFWGDSCRPLFGLLGELFAFKFLLNNTNEGLEARLQLGGFAGFDEPIKSEIPRLADFPLEFFPPSVTQSMRHTYDETVFVLSPCLQNASKSSTEQKNQRTLPLSCPYWKRICCQGIAYFETFLPTASIASCLFCILLSPFSMRLTMRL